MKRVLAGLSVIIILIIIVVMIIAFGGGRMRNKDMISLDEERYMDKIRGAWLGKMVGVSLGIPTEFKFTNRIGSPEEVPVWTPDTIKKAFIEDDLYIPFAYMQVLKEKGIDVAPKEMTISLYPYGFEFWGSHYEIYEKGVAPPDSGHPNQNRWADGLSYSFAGDYSGLIAMGQPNVPIELADKYGRLLVYGDGIFGGMYIGAMYSEALINDNLEEIIQAGLDAVPKESWLYETISDTIKWYKETPDDFEAVWYKIMEKYFWNEKYNWIEWPYGGRIDGANMDTKVNCAFITLALLYGDYNVETTLETAIRLGGDSDCNPSNALGILFTTLGYSSIDQKYKEGLDLEEKFRYVNITFDEAAELTYFLAKEVLIKNGGTVEKKNGTELLTIRKQEAVSAQNENSLTPNKMSSSLFTEEEMSRMYKPYLQDSGFEESWHQAVFYPWRISYENGVYAGIDLNQGKSHSGENNAYLLNNQLNWAELSQNRIKIKPNTTYYLSCYVKTSENFPGGEIGVRLPVFDGISVLQKSEFSAEGEYSKVGVTFESQDNQIIDIYIGYYGNNEDTWIQIDDFDLTEIN